MPQPSTQTYSLSETAQIIGAEEKQIHLFARKGLIDPALSNDPAARFSLVDCARLKFIKRADELGYAPDSIFDLIGPSNEVLNTPDPAASSEQFAMNKYKQIYEELNHCELLEQINKQCDLKLLKTYIQNLKELRKKGTLDAGTPKSAPLAEEPPPAAQKDRPSAAQTGNRPRAEAHVQRYSVEKLWDYFNDVEQREKSDSASPQEQPHPDADGHLDGWEPPKSGSSLLSEAQRFLDSEYWLTRAEGLRETLGRRDWTAWIAVGFLIAIIAVIGYFMISGHRKQALQKPAVALNTKPQNTVDAKAPDQEQGTEPTPSQPSQTVTDGQPAGASKQPVEQQPAGQHPDAGMLYSPDSIKDSANSAAAGKPETPQAQKPATISSPGALPPVERVQEPTAPSEVPALASKGPASDNASPDQPATALERQAAPTGEPSPSAAAPVRVKDLKIWHDNLNSYYRADLTILKNKTGNDALVDGFIFVFLMTGNAGPGQEGLLLPSGELLAGMPSQFERGARFSIRHLKEMSLAAPSTLPPSDITSGKVLVFSPAGRLMLDQPFNTPVRPFFSTAGERYDASVEKLAGSATVATDTPEAAESRPSAAPQEPTAEVQPTAKAPQVEKSESPSPQSTAKAPQAEQTESQPQHSRPRHTPAENNQAAAKIQRTDNPEAAIWEQKSYDAATQGNFDLAINNATKAIKLDPGRVNPYVNRAWAYIEKDKYDNAIQDCSTALSLDSRNALAYNNRGLAYQLKNDTRKAQDDYRQACNLGMQLGCQNLNAIVHQNRVSELINQSQKAFRNKDWDGVVRATTEALNLDPENSVAFANRSAAYAQKSYLRKALKDSNEAIRYNPEFPLAYNNRGYVFELLGSNEKAAADYLKSCSLGSDLGCKNFERLNGAQ